MIKKFLIGFVIGMVMVYLLESFVRFNLNPANWPEIFRVFFSTVGLLVSTLTGLVNTWISDNK